MFCETTEYCASQNRSRIKMAETEKKALDFDVVSSITIILEGG